MLVQEESASSPGAVRIAVVAGAAGLGKTTLAVHAAHQVRTLFPDGQLYVDLSGASAQPTAPGEVLARFLRDLGVEGDKVPVGDDERAALYRTRLTGRRVLVLLDNAKDAAQVRPLLPGSVSSAVLVTTRNRTPDLASTRAKILPQLVPPLVKMAGALSGALLSALIKLLPPLAQLATVYYFFHFLILLPILGKIERPLPLPPSIAEAVLKKAG